VQAEKLKLPWWRRALEFALGGIRSGFGLFGRNGRSEHGTDRSTEVSVSDAAPAHDDVELGTESDEEPEIIETEPDKLPEHAEAEAEAEVEKSAGPESGSKHDNSECEVELAGAEGKEKAGHEYSPEEVKNSEIEPVELAPTELDKGEIALVAIARVETATVGSATIEPPDFPVFVAAESALAEQETIGDEVAEAEMNEKEVAEEEIELTHPSPQVDDSEPQPGHREPPAPEQAPPAQEPPEPEPAPPAEEPPEPEPAGPVKTETAAAATADASLGAVPVEQAAPATPAEAPVADVHAEPLPVEIHTERTTAEKVAAALKARGVDAEQSPFSVIVSQVYDGPLDLLLDLIRKQDIDIYDIPIAKITAQFLAYVDRLRASDMDVAGDFIYTAALLIHIKSKMLLPRAPVGPEESAEDPRRELVDRLLEHERFKNAAQMLHEKQMLEAATWTNPGVREFREDAAAEPEIAADTTDLVRIFRDILDRARNRPILNVEEDSVTVGQMIQFLTRRLTMEDKPVALHRLLSHTHSERALIAMFLGLLELVRLQAILLRQDRQFSEIFVKKNTGFDAVVNNGLASAQDDWR
jgi:segregation and condensation protein A